MSEMIKVVLGGSFDSLDRFAEIVKVSSKGLDTGWLTKRASVSDRISELKPEPGKTYVHLLALGDGETYGCNRNGDFFSKQANQDYHKTFETNARFYRHHANTDPEKSYGAVKIAEYNPAMHRVELVVALDNEKSAEELDLLEKKGEFPVSMACRVPYDICSICMHKAAYRNPKFDNDPNAYCEHALNHLTKIAADGRQVYVDNTHPTFFDISRVTRPADRIAYTFEKVASGSAVSGTELAAELGYYSAALASAGTPGNFSKKTALLRKLAAIESSNKSDLTFMVGCSDLPDTLITKLAEYATTQDRLQDVFNVLANKRILLSVNDFLKLAAAENYRQAKPLLTKISNCLPRVYNTIKESEVADFCGDATYDCSSRSIPKTLITEIDRAAAASALNMEAVQHRLIKSASTQKINIVPKTVNRSDDLAMPVAREYAKYQLSFLTKLAGQNDSEFLECLTIASNIVR